MRICRVQIENYRNLKSVDVNLGNIVTLIGENNSGKSNFLKAIALPLTLEDGVQNKRLSWHDINKESKDAYYEFLMDNRTQIVNGIIEISDIVPVIPKVVIRLYFIPDDNEHYDINDILSNDDGNWIGAIEYSYSINKPDDLLDRLKQILAFEEDHNNIEQSLLPMELFSHSIVVPDKKSSISYDTLARFRVSVLSAERDSFSSNADKLGSKALSDLLKRNITIESEVEIEKKYSEFFELVRTTGDFHGILNWQNYSDIENAKGFFKQIDILPNMPRITSVLGSIRLGYENESMHMQGLGHRNLVLMAVILNSYVSKNIDFSYRMITIEEPEAHLCKSNILLMSSLFNVFNRQSPHSQMIFSTHSTEFVNKIGIENVIVFHNGNAYSLCSVLDKSEREYLVANPNTDIFSILYSRRLILVEGITEELLIKSYLQSRIDLNDIKVLSFHKGFTKIINIWMIINRGSDNRLGIVRDYDNQPNAQSIHESMETPEIMVGTTKGYTLESDILKNNYDILREYFVEFGWENKTESELEFEWRNNKKVNAMLSLCHGLRSGMLPTFKMPEHISDIIDFMQVKPNED